MLNKILNLISFFRTNLIPKIPVKSGNNGYTIQKIYNFGKELS